MTSQKYRISDLAKDLDVKAKDISDILTASGYGQKNRMAVLSPAEFEIVMNTFTLKNKTDDLEKYRNMYEKRDIDVVHFVSN